MTDLDFSEGLKSLSCETLILCGAKDSANKKAAMGLAANITGANLKFIENASHEVNKNSPEKLAAELEMFYKGQNPPNKIIKRCYTWKITLNRYSST